MSKTLKVFTAFSGYDSQCLGLNKVKAKNPDFDYELVGWSEIDPYAIKAHNILFPEAADKNYGDISKINWDEVPPIDLFTYSSPCFVAGTKVMTINGYKNIEDIVAGDFVMAHNRRYERVIKPMKKLHFDELYTISSESNPNVICTADHPFYVKQMIPNDGLSDEAVWKKASELTENDYVGTPLDSMNRIPVITGEGYNTYEKWFNTTNFWYLIGVISHFPSSIIDEYETLRIDISGADNVRELIKKVGTICSELLISWENNDKDEIKIIDRHLCKFISTITMFGSLLYQLPPQHLKMYVEGALQPNIEERSDDWKVATTILNKTLEITPIIHCIAKAFESPVDIRYVGGKTILMWDYQSDGVAHMNSYCVDGYMWSKITKVESSSLKGGFVYVYNMSVENAESYTANGIAVHNCTDVSMAGQREGIEEGSGTRSSLLWECRKCIEKKRPKYLLFENVLGLVTQKFLPHFYRWQKVVEDLGYANFWTTLNSKDYGVPQNRERVFLVSIRKDSPDEVISYNFPNAMQTNCSIEDILEKDVDEKYYITQSRVDEYVKNNEERIVKYINMRKENKNSAPGSIKDVPLDGDETLFTEHE